MAHKKKKKLDKYKHEKNKSWRNITGIKGIRKTCRDISRLPTFLKAVNDFRSMYKSYKGNIPEHVEFSADPVVEILYPFYAKLINDETPMLYEKHVRGVIRDAGGFVMYILSQDTAYRSFRNWFLHQLVQPETVNRLRLALAEEREVENYLNPEEWYDNMKIKSIKITQEKREQGLIPKDAVSMEQVGFMDEESRELFRRKIKNKEV